MTISKSELEAKEVDAKPIKTEDSGFRLSPEDQKLLDQQIASDKWSEPITVDEFLKRLDHGTL